MLYNTDMNKVRYILLSLVVVMLGSAILSGCNLSEEDQDPTSAEQRALDAVGDE